MKQSLLFAAVSLVLGVGSPVMASDSWLMDQGVLEQMFLTDNQGPQQPPAPQDPGQKPPEQDQSQDHGQDQGQDGQESPNQDRQEGHRIEKFTAICYYENKDNPEGFRSCKVGALFNKEVSDGGGEMTDDPAEIAKDPSSTIVPQFRVECDRTTRHSDGARRITNLLSTRIIGFNGPHPQIYLPRGALHTGKHVAESFLEIEDGAKLFRSPGKCYIWTGDL